MLKLGHFSPERKDQLGVQASQKVKFEGAISMLKQENLTNTFSTKPGAH